MKTTLGDRARGHLQVPSSPGAEAITPTTHHPALLPGMAGTFLNHRSHQTLSSLYAPSAAHCPQGKSSSNQRAWGSLPRPTGSHLLPSSSREVHGGSSPPQASAHQVLDTIDLSLTLLHPPHPPPSPAMLATPSLGPGTHPPRPRQGLPYPPT